MYAPAGSADPDVRPLVTRLGIALVASIVLHAVMVASVALAPNGAPMGGDERDGILLQSRLVHARPSFANPPPPAFRTRPAATGEPAVREPLAAAPAHESAQSTASAVKPQFGFVPEAIYHPASELDARPQPTMDITPAYPRAAPPDGGYVVIELLIDETGAVDHVRVAVADPEGVFDQTVAETFSAARFTPGVLSGTAVKSRTWMELRFHPIAPPDSTVPAGAGNTPR